MSRMPKFDPECGGVRSTAMAEASSCSLILILVRVSVRDIFVRLVPGFVVLPGSPVVTLKPT